MNNPKVIILKVNDHWLDKSYIILENVLARWIQIKKIRPMSMGVYYDNDDFMMKKFTIVFELKP